MLIHIPQDFVLRDNRARCRHLRPPHQNGPTRRTHDLISGNTERERSEEWNSGDVLYASDSQPAKIQRFRRPWRQGCQPATQEAAHVTASP